MRDKFGDNPIASDAFGATLRTEVLKFQLDNKTAQAIAVKLEGKEATISLISAKGETISQASYEYKGALGDLLEAKLVPDVNEETGEAQTPCIWLKFEFGDITCDLTSLYDKINGEIRARQLGDEALEASKADKAATYTKTETDGLLAGKADKADVYTKSEANSLLSGKADLIDGKVPSSQLPSYVDDVIEYASRNAFPAEGEAGKIYVALNTNDTYRWSGSEYIQINEIDLSNYYTKTEVDSAIGAIDGHIAHAYDSTATYAVGAFCVYDKKLYKCITAIAVAEAWTDAH